MMFKSVKKRIAARQATVRRMSLLESLEGRKYFYAPDLYIPITGGCSCGGCVACLGGPSTAESASAASAAAPLNASASALAARTPFAAAAAASPAVTGLVLYNAETGQPIGSFANGATIDYSTLPTRKLSVRAETSGTVGSVRFGLDGQANFQTENFAPYSIKGDTGSGLPNAWTPSAGSHKLTVTAYSGSRATGTAGTPLVVNFSVTEGTSTPPPTSNVVVSFSDAAADAKEQGLDKGTWVISRTGSTASALTVSYAVSGAATNGVDYQTLSGSIVIPAGKSSVNLIVMPKEDALVEGTETVIATIVSGSGYSIGSANSANCPILDNDTNSTPSTTIKNITWKRGVARSPEPRTEAGVVQIGSKVYAIGGFTARGGTGTYFPLTRRVDVYDMATKQWKQLASLPSQAAGNHFGAASDGKYIYVVAGQIKDTYGSGTNTTWRYNISANKWEQFESLPAIRFGGAAFVENGWLHFVGGSKSDRTTVSTDHWAIDLSDANAEWIRKASIPLGGDHLSHATVNGKVYIIGGEHDHEGVNGVGGGAYIQHKYVFQYNPGSDTWVRKADMPFGASHNEGSTFVINNQIVVIGGILDGGGNNITSKVRVFNPVTNTWKTLTTNYPKRISGPTGGYWNGKIYLTDGYSPDERDRSVGYEGTIVV